MAEVRSRTRRSLISVKGGKQSTPSELPPLPQQESHQSEPQVEKKKEECGQIMTYERLEEVIQELDEAEGRSGKDGSKPQPVKHVKDQTRDELQPL